MPASAQPRSTRWLEFYEDHRRLVHFVVAVVGVALGLVLGVLWKKPDPTMEVIKRFNGIMKAHYATLDAIDLGPGDNREKMRLVKEAVGATCEALRATDYTGCDAGIQSVFERFTDEMEQFAAGIDERRTEYASLRRRAPARPAPDAGGWRAGGLVPEF